MPGTLHGLKGHQGSSAFVYLDGYFHAGRNTARNKIANNLKNNNLKKKIEHQRYYSICTYICKYLGLKNSVS